MFRVALAALGLLALTACEMSPEQADRMSALGRSMQYQGNVWTAASRPVYTAPAYAPGTVRYCGTDGMGNAYLCY